MNEPNIFIWRGGRRGGVEKIALVLAEGFKKYQGLTPTLGVFEREKREFPQLRVKRFFPEKLAGYNAAWGTYYLNKSGALKPFDIAFSHSGLFLKTKENFYVCYECGDLEKQLKLIPKLSAMVATPVIKLHLHMMKKADLVVIPLEELGEFLLRHGIKEYEVCPASYVDTKTFKPLKILEGKKFVLLFVGRTTDPRKNFNTLAYVGLKLRKEVEICAVDSTRRRERKENLHFLGGVSTRELVFWYNRCDLFILPSFWEGIPIVILEALACEKPVLASESSVPRAMKEFVTVFNPFSWEDLKEKILWAMKNYEELREKAREGRKFVRKHFETDRVMKRLTGLILEHWEERK